MVVAVREDDVSPMVSTESREVAESWSHEYNSGDDLGFGSDLGRKSGIADMESIAGWFCGESPVAVLWVPWGESFPAGYGSLLSNPLEGQGESDNILCVSEWYPGNLNAV